MGQPQVAQWFSTTFSPGRDPGDLGSSPTSVSLHGACFSLCLCFSLSLSLSVCLPWINKIIKTKQKRWLIHIGWQVVAGCWTGVQLRLLTRAYFLSLWPLPVARLDFSQYSGWVVSISIHRKTSTYQASAHIILACISLAKTSHTVWHGA